MGVVTRKASAEEITRRAVGEAAWQFVGEPGLCLRYRHDHDRWAVWCEDYMWRLVKPEYFDKFLTGWLSGRFGRHIPSEPGSEFRRIIETLMLGRPRLAAWLPDPSLRAYHTVYEFSRVDGSTHT